MDDTELRTILNGALEEAVRLARTGQQAIEIGVGVQNLSERLTALSEREPDLGPEVLAALKGLRACSEAVGRLVTTNHALLDARLDNLFPDEGGPS